MLFRLLYPYTVWEVCFILLILILKFFESDEGSRKFVESDSLASQIVHDLKQIQGFLIDDLYLFFCISYIVSDDWIIKSDIVVSYDIPIKLQYKIDKSLKIIPGNIASLKGWFVLIADGNISQCKR